MGGWTPEAVLDEAARWLWVPDFAVRVSTEEYDVVGYPQSWEHPTQVLRCRTDRPVAEVVAEVHAHVGSMGRPEVGWWVGPGTRPIGLREHLGSLGARLVDTVDVLGCDLTAGVPTPLVETTEASVPDAGPVDVRAVEDEASLRRAWAVDQEVWGYGVPPDAESVAREIAEALVPLPEREAFRSLAHVDGEPAATGGCTRVGPVARLWGAGTRPSLRGRGAYRAVLAHRVGVAHGLGATLALVKGRVATSAPILRRLGFTAYGQEHLYLVDART